MDLWKPVVVISAGAALGALLRWRLGVAFNTLLPDLPPGTLLANLLGGYVIGLAVAVFLQVPSLAPEWRLFVITGFCGGLTTFSTFSAEVVGLLQAGNYLWAFGTIGAHLFGSLVATLAGMASWRLVQQVV